MLLYPQDFVARLQLSQGADLLESGALKPEPFRTNLRPMSKRFVTLAWIAALCAYLLIILGAVVRISGSGMGCGDRWPLCNGHLFPSLNDIPTVIEWSHRLVAAVLSVLVIALVVLDWRRAWPVLALLVVQVLLGAVTVKTGL